MCTREAKYAQEISRKGTDRFESSVVREGYTDSYNYVAGMWSYSLGNRD